MKILFLSILTLLIIAGCGGGNSNTPTSKAKLNRGYYIDSPVVGLDYICGNINSKTNQNGEFNFYKGDSCKFLIGTVVLREVSVNELYDGVKIYENNLAVARVLQTVDVDGNPDKDGITVATKSKECLKDTLNKDVINNVSDSEIENLYQCLKKDSSYDGRAVTLSEAKAHIQKVRGSVDKIAPVITIKGDNPLILEIGSSFTDPGATALDNIDGNLSVSSNSNVDTSKVGEYTITYSAIDSSGNKTTAIRVVKVIEKSSNTIDIKALLEYSKKLDFNRSGKIVLENAPKGMSIYPNGKLVWTPTKDQVGEYSVTINLLNDDIVVDSKVLNFQVSSNSGNYDGVFVDLSAKKGGVGTPQDPYGTFKEACENLSDKHNIYIRGGVYFNPGYHKDYTKSGRYPSVSLECQGTKNNPIVIRPWGNEYVKLKTDALYGIKIKPGTKYITVQNLEIEGEAKSITLNEALKYWWWDSNDTMQSSGIVANGDNIVIKNNVVHDMPGSGISVNEGTFADIEGNIVYNCDWWTIAGSKGIGITSAKGSNANGEYKNKIVGNLIFNIEQRLFSHVWKKGFATLTIDEGEAFLIQEGKQVEGTNSSSYNGKYLVKSNLILYNGKAASINLAKDVNLSNNSFYNNGGATKQAGFRVGHSKRLSIENNAVESNIPNTIIYSQDRASSDITLKNNYAKGTITKDGSQVIGINKVDKLFNNPDNFDFSIVSNLPQNIGVSSSMLANIKSKLELFNINVQREHINIDQSAQSKYIVEHAPGKIDCSHYNDDKDPYILITDINSSHTLVKDLGITEFKLYIKHKFGECIDTIDKESPRITLKGDQNITIYSDEQFIDPGFEAIDNVDGNLTSSVTKSGSVQLTPGNYTIAYSVSDSSDNKTEAKRFVTIRLVPYADSQNVEVVEDKNVSITLSSATYDTSKTSYTIVSSPQHGTISGEAPHLIYTPNEEFVGSDSFSYKVSDGTRESNIAVVDINITPSNITKALRSGNASLLSEQEIYEKLDKTATKSEQTCRDRVNFIFKNGYSNSFDTLWASNRTSSISSKNTPIFVSKIGNKDYSYGWIGEKDSSSRYAFVGMSIFSAGRMGNGQDEVTYKALNSELVQLFNWLLKQDKGSNIFNDNLTILTQSSREESDIKTWTNEHNINITNWNFTHDLSLLDSGNFDIFVLLTPSNPDSINKAFEHNKAVLVYTDWIYNNKKVLESFGLKYGSYGGATIDNLNSKYEICNTTPTKKMLKAIHHLQNSDLDFDYSKDGACTSYVGKVTCHSDKLLNINGETLGEAFMDGANFIKSSLQRYDAQGVNVFDTNETLLKLAVLLGDKYRQNITYPMDKVKTDDTNFYKALFADYSVAYARANNKYQPDLGDYTSHPETLHNMQTQDVNVTLTPTSYSEWTSALIYALPGKEVTIKRVDNSDNEVKVRLTMIRSGSSRIWNRNAYTRPQFVRSHEITIEKGKVYHFSSPYGGPFMIYSKGVTSNAKPFTLEFRNVAKHPTISHLDNQQEIDDFVAKLDSSPFDWVDIKTPFVEIHSLKSKMKEAFSTGGSFPYHNNAKLYFQDLKHYLIESNLNLAGFKGVGLALNSNIQAFCSEYNLDCTSNIHIKPPVQHYDSDNRAMCGSGCAGNPIDVTWGVEPTNWGDNHEFGHNLQRAKLKIYGGRSTEVSNNIFPIHANWLYLKEHNMSVHPDSNTALTLEAFNILYKAIKDGKSATLAEHPLWRESGTYDKAFERLAFYNQLVYEEGSWDIYTKLYLVERLFSDAIKSDTKWNNNKDKLGFSNYTRGEANRINGNDFMAIALSKFTKRDYRAYFNMWGIEVSQKASDQIDANGFTTFVPREFFLKNRDDLRVKFPTKTVILDGTDITKEILSGVCEETILSKCNSINIVHSINVPQIGSIYFVSKYADNGPINSTSSSSTNYSTLQVEAVDDLNQTVTLKLRAAKTTDAQGADGVLVPMNDTHTVNDTKTSLIVWIDPNDNTLEAGRTYKIADTPIIKVMNGNQMVEQIIVKIKDFQLPQILTINDSTKEFIRGYPQIEGSSTYFVTTKSSQGPTKGEWSFNSPSKKLTIKVTDDNGNIYEMKLSTKRDGFRESGHSGYYNDINSGGSWGGYTGNALIVWFDKSVNPNLPAGHYRSIEPVILNAKLWHQGGKLREVIYVNVDFTISN